MALAGAPRIARCEQNVWRNRWTPLTLTPAHGAEEAGLKKKHQQKLVEMLPKAERALNELLDQTDHLPSRLNAVKEVHDRALGPVRGGEQGKSGVQVNIGIFGHPQIVGEPMIDVEAVEVED